MARCNNVVNSRKCATNSSNAESASGSELAERERGHPVESPYHPRHVALGPFPSILQNTTAEEGVGFGGKFSRAFLQFVTCVKLIMGCLGLGLYIASGGLEVAKVGFFLWYNSGPKSAILVHGEYIYEISMGFLILGLMAQKTYGKWTEFLFQLWFTITVFVLLTTLFICPGLHLFNYSDPGRLVHIGKFQFDPINWMLQAALMDLNQLVTFISYLSCRDYAIRTRLN